MLLTPDRTPLAENDVGWTHDRTAPPRFGPPVLLSSVYVSTTGAKELIAN
jgi:hypothetical protein